MTVTFGFFFVIPFAVALLFIFIYFMIQVAAAAVFGFILFVRFIIHICKEIAWGVRRAHRWLLTRG